MRVRLKRFRRLCVLAIHYEDEKILLEVQQLAYEAEAEVNAALLDALTDENEEIREASFEIAQDLGIHHFSGKLREKAISIALDAIDNESYDIVYCAVRMLGAASERKEVQEKLVVALGRHDETVQMAIIDLLEPFAGEAFVQNALIECYRDRYCDEGVQTLICKVLAPQVSNKTVRAMLIENLLGFYPVTESVIALLSASKEQEIKDAFNLIYEGSGESIEQWCDTAIKNIKRSRGGELFSDILRMSIDSATKAQN